MAIGGVIRRPEIQGPIRRDSRVIDISHTALDGIEVALRISPGEPIQEVIVLDSTEGVRITSRPGQILWTI